MINPKNLILRDAVQQGKGKKGCREELRLLGAFLNHHQRPPDLKHLHCLTLVIKTHCPSELQMFPFFAVRCLPGSRALAHKSFQPSEGAERKAGRL